MTKKRTRAPVTTKAEPTPRTATGCRTPKTNSRKKRNFRDEERLPDLGRLEETAWVDLIRIHDPRNGETDHVLLGIELEESQKMDLRFLPTMDIHCLGPALIYAFERLGGLPTVVELPLIPPFCRRVGDEPPALHPELDGLSHAFKVLFLFPSLHELPAPWWGRTLEISFRRVVREFLPGRPPESLAARNHALETWILESRSGRCSPPPRRRAQRKRRES